MVIDQGCMCRLPRGSGSCCSPWSSPCRRCSTSARCWLSSLLSMQSSGWQSSATSSTREPSTTSSTSRPSGDPCSFSSGAEHQNTLIRHLNKWHDFTSNLLGHLRVRHSLYLLIYTSIVYQGWELVCLHFAFVPHGSPSPWQDKVSLLANNWTKPQTSAWTPPVLLQPPASVNILEEVSTGLHEISQCVLALSHLRHYAKRA